jgi:murein DD-endopeptidase MepM/ murein hydrolase activator NlpD
MADTLIERAWAWLHATFPERQIYIRSDGRVQFFTFGAALQATMAGLSLIFLGWVAFASVNVIFKDRIIAAKDHRYQQMQSTYENRVADLQLNYDELQGALVSAEDKFKSTADQLEAKQRTVARLLGRKEMVDATLASLSGGARAALGNADIPASASSNAASDSIGGGSGPAPLLSSAPTPSVGGDGDADDGGSSQLAPQPVAPQPRTARPTRASFLDETVGKLAGALFRQTQQQPPQASAAVLRNPAFRILAAQTDRIQRLGGAETALLQGVDQQVSVRIADLEGLLRRVGMNPDTFERTGEGVGGPLIPMKDLQIDGIADPAFTAAYAGASAHGLELDALFAGLRHVPLTTPVHGAGFEETSGFGARVDPFTRHVAFHSGIDFAGPWGASVAATAPGTVVFAGPRGGYGNMVEVDHGFGMRTRYGHLASILVKVGAKVSKGTSVGRLGSTGRSTGPHVHYEVWLADVVRDPSRFIEAGRHVLQ